MTRRARVHHLRGAADVDRGRRTAQLHPCEVRQDRPLQFGIHGDDDTLSDLCRAFDIEITQSFSCELTFTRIKVVGALASTARDGDIGPVSDQRGELGILDFIPCMRLV
jgi:hypothetical protein